MITIAFVVLLRMYMKMASLNLKLVPVILIIIYSSTHEIWISHSLILQHTKAMSPQTNGICERFHKTILNEFYQVTFRKKLYDSLDNLQKGLDDWMVYYNNERTHQGKICCGRTPLDTLVDGKSVWTEKKLAQI